MYKIITCTVTEFSQNARILACTEDNTAIMIDPGGEISKLMLVIEQHRLKPTAIWLTHSHLDHCGAVAQLLENFAVPLYGHRIERQMREHVVNIANMYGITSGYFNCPEPSNYLEGGESLEFAGATFQVIFTPGHAPGHLCFYDAANKTLLAGDTLFAGSVGRTDLPGGDQATLIRSIKEKLYTLPNDTKVLPGHGPETTIGAEKGGNAFIKG